LPKLRAESKSNEAFKRSAKKGPVTWTSFLLFVLAGGGIVYYVRYLKQEKEQGRCMNLKIHPLHWLQGILVVLKIVLEANGYVLVVVQNAGLTSNPLCSMQQNIINKSHVYQLLVTH